MSSWSQESLYNLKHLVALRELVRHFRESPLKWLLYEISPRFYKRGGFSWAALNDEFIGWSIHTTVGFFVMLAFLFVARRKGWPLYQGYYVLLALGFGIEIGELFPERFFYFTPINHALDISFYVFGGFIFISLRKLWLKRQGLIP